MRTHHKFILAAITIGLGTSVPSGQARSSQPTAIQPGSQVVVDAGATSLMRGRQTLATLGRGQKLQVLQIQGPWVGTVIQANGRAIGGWVWHEQVTTPERFAARRPATRRFSYQPTPSMESPLPRSGPYPYATNVLPPDMRDYYTGGLRSGSPLIMGATRYGRNYWRADRKIIGY